ncbi:MAG: hypothetical protein ACP5NS_02200 [Candidatus Pacearchaeota archaeon]
MNRRGGTEIGQILTTPFALMLVFVIMVIFVVVSGYLSAILNEPAYESPVTPFERENIVTYFPPQNAETNTLIDTFLKSELRVEGKIVTVEQAIEQMCRVGSGPYYRENLAPLLVKNFDSVSVDGVFAIAGSAAGRDAGYLLYAYSPKLQGVTMDIGPQLTQDNFNKNFDKPTLQKKTICASIRPHTVYIIPGGAK